MKWNVDIAFVTVQNSLITSRTARYTFSNLIHNRVMTTRLLYKMELVEDPKCLYCRSEESLIHAFLECENVTNLWRSIELWVRYTLNKHVKISEINKKKIFGINNGDIIVNNFSSKGGYLY